MAETMHDLDWLFAIGVIFFLLSAWSLGKSFSNTVLLTIACILLLAG